MKSSPSTWPLLVLLAATATLGACASGAPDAQASNKGLICSREPTIGSNVPYTRCRTPEQIEEERRAAREAQDSLRSVPGAQRGGSGS